ncbi:MAG: gas vesicle protein GvpO [Candidatus Bathyarchaeia archaeon]
MTQNKLSLFKITEVALDAAKRFLSKNPETIVDIKEKNGEWAVTVEVLQRKSIPDTQDLLARYVIRLDEEGKVIGWTQKMVRKRSDRIASEIEE